MFFSLIYGCDVLGVSIDAESGQGAKEITFYNLRHTYATWQLYKGVDPYLLKENLGTGLTYLENHYGQVETRKLRDELTKDFDESMRYLIEE